MSEREQMETEVIKLLITSYFSLSKRTLIDMVPKGLFFRPGLAAIWSDPLTPAAIMLNLVFRARDDLQRELLGELYKPDVMGKFGRIARSTSSAS